MPTWQCMWPGGACSWPGCSGCGARGCMCRVTMSAREQLSVVVTTFNNAGTLDACLRGVSWADEIVVLDSGSTDATVEIAAHISEEHTSELQSLMSNSYAVFCLQKKSSNY